MNRIAPDNNVKVCLFSVYEDDHSVSSVRFVSRANYVFLLI